MNGEMLKESKKMNKDELIIKNIIKYINELDLITKDKDKTFFFDNTNEFNKVINRVVKIGECLSKISEETKNKYFHINWNIIKEKALDEEKAGHEMNVKDTYDLGSKLLKEELYDKLIELIKR
jgi:hypothetical protein